MDSNNKATMDGRPGLLAFAGEFHPRHEHTIVDLERRLRRLGFEVTDTNEDRIVIAGPLQTTTACRTLVLFGGAMRVRHFAVVKALELLTQTGVPLWAPEHEQFEWHLKQLEQCASFQAPVQEEFETRAEMEAHVEQCDRCRPAFDMLIEAVNRGSRRTNDGHLKELIERSHKDSDLARQFYEGVRDAQAAIIPAERPQRPARRGQEVSA